MRKVKICRTIVGVVALQMVPIVGVTQQATPVDGAVYERGARDGVAFEQCLLSDGRAYQHFALFERGDFAYLATEGWTISLDVEDGIEDGISMYSFSDTVECDDGECSTVEQIYQVDGDPNGVAITWTTRRVNDEMDVVVYEFPEEDGMRATCAVFPVKGPTCLAVLEKLRDFVSREGIDASALRLRDEWCE